MLQPEKILEKAKLLEKSDKREAENQYSELIRAIQSAEVIQRRGQNLTHHLATAYNNRGFLRYLAVDFDQASDDYSACLQIDPNFTVAYYNRGMVHYRLESCLGRCGQPPDSNYLCQCNSACSQYNDCCDDYGPYCLGATCANRCGTGVDRTKPCQCNTACANYGDCCTDYNSLCNGGGSNPVLCDMSCLAQKLWDNDINKISLIDVNHNYQGQTSTSGASDDAPGNLFVSVNENHFHTKPTFQKFIALLDNYEKTIGMNEDLTPAEWAEIEDFLDAAIPTDVMQLAYGHLLDNGLVTSATHFRDTLKELWFNLYPRSSSAGSAVDSSGFEHAMVGELRGTVSGFHSWIQFYLEEKKGNINYLGWSSKADPEMIGATFTWHGQLKGKGSFFMRTSPEFDLALYSVCALTKPNAICSFTMAGHSIRIQTWDIAHKAGAQIASAYPAI